MKKKEIKILKAFTRCGLDFKKEDKFIVSVLQIQQGGWIERYGCDGTMDGEFYPVVIVEFENGKIIHFRLDDEISIIGNAE